MLARKSLFVFIFFFQFIFAQEPFTGSGNWLELDGTNDYASASDNSSLDIGLGDGEDFTIECFFYIPDLLDENLEGIILKENSYWLYINMNTAAPDRILFYISSGSAFVIYADVNLSVGWHHVAACYINNTGSSNDDMNLFLDGSRVATYTSGTFSINPGITNGALSFYSGTYWSGVHNTFHGRLDEMRVSDILRYSGTTYTVPTSEFTNDANTRALWHYNESASSTSFTDASSNNNTQTGLNGGQALPVELSSFIAKAYVDKVILEWETITEINNYGFNIERTVENLNNDWQTIGFMKGYGNSNSPKQYSFTDDNLAGGNNFLYRLKQIDNDGQSKYSNIVEVAIVPGELMLHQNYPNPFNPITRISYSIPYMENSNKKFVQLKVFDINGSEVAVLVNEEKPTGTYEIEFDATNLSSGIYFYEMKAGDFISTKKMLLLK